MSIRFIKNKVFVRHPAYQLSKDTAQHPAHVGEEALLFCNFHCYDYRTSYHYPNTIYKSQKKATENDKRHQNGSSLHSHYELLDLHPKHNKTAYFGELHRKK
ncbi:hypothetical protein CHARACLAT_009252 [Characodon lateralis]|uniref:Uncharacterized protein n=1 Tax=Characodon lateralis TaxID=208331 RepID=A0ABU7EHL8_9TELE|nr:hypothetical protein [Characodon lateralis]